MGADRTALAFPWELQAANVSPSVVGTAVASFETLDDLLAVVAPTNGVMAETAGASVAGDGAGATYRYQSEYAPTPVFPQSARPVGDLVGAWVQTSQTGAGTTASGDVTGPIGNNLVTRIAGARIAQTAAASGQFLRASGATDAAFGAITRGDLPPITDPDLPSDTRYYSLATVIPAGQVRPATHITRVGDAPHMVAVSAFCPPRLIAHLGALAGTAPLPYMLTQAYSTLVAAQADFSWLDGASYGAGSLDWAALQAGIRWCESLGNYNATLWVEHGAYGTTLPLVCHGGVMIMGQGSSGTNQALGTVLMHFANSADCIQFLGDADPFGTGGFSGTGGGLQNLTIVKAERTGFGGAAYNGGVGVYIQAQSMLKRPGEMLFSNVVVYAENGAASSWTHAWHADGKNAITPGAAGIRSITMRKCRGACASTAFESILLDTVTHFTAHHLQTDPGSNPASDGLTIKGTCTNVIIDGAIIDGVLVIEDGDSVNVTTITNANPAVLTCAAPHGIPVGQSASRVVASVAGMISAVTSTGSGTPPVLSITGTQNGAIKNFRVEVTDISAGTALTQWKGKYTLDSMVASPEWTYFTSAASFGISGPAGATGATLNIAAGTAALDQVWTAKTINQHFNGIIDANQVTATSTTAFSIPVDTTGYTAYSSGGTTYPEGPKDISVSGRASETSITSLDVTGIVSGSTGYWPYKKANSFSYSSASPEVAIVGPNKPKWRRCLHYAVAGVTGDGTIVSIPLDTLSYDRNLDYGSAGPTLATSPFGGVLVAGHYRITLRATFASLVAATHQRCDIRIRTSSTKYLQKIANARVAVSANGLLTLEVSDTFKLAAGDFVFFEGSATGSGAKDVGFYGDSDQGHCVVTAELL